MKNTVSPAALKDAQHQIGAAIGACLALWYAPFVSGVACNMAEKKLVTSLLHTLGQSDIDEKTNQLFWFHRKRMLIFNMFTYLPWVGTSLQVLEVYSMGQFVIRCAADADLDIHDKTQLAAAWDSIQEDIFSGASVARSYERFTGKSFPAAIEPQFVSAVDTFSKAYRTADRLPGVMHSQEVVVETAQKAAGAVTDAARSATTYLKSLW